MSSYESAIRYTTALSRKQRRQKDLQSTAIASAGGGSGPTSGVVTLTGDQNIFGVKRFEDGFSIGGIRFYRSQDETVYIEGNLVTSGGITARGKNTTTTPSLFDALPIDSRTIKRDANGMLYVDADELGIGGGGGGSAEVTYESVISALGYTPLSTAGGTVTSTGRRQLSLQSSTDAQAALWLGTGIEQFTKGGFLQYDYSNGAIALVNFSAMSNSYSGLAGLFIKRDNRITVGDAKLSVEYDILHTGNIGEYALPITGGTVNGNGRFVMQRNGDYSSIGPEVTALTISTNAASYSGYNTGISFNALGNYSSLTHKNHIHAWIGLGGAIDTAMSEIYPLVFAVNSSTTTGTAPTVRMKIMPSGSVVVDKHFAVGANIGQANVTRAQLDVISADANPSDITMGADNKRYWGLTARNANGGVGKAFGIYNYTASSYALFVTETNNVAIGGDVTPTERLRVTATSGWCTTFKNTNTAVSASHTDGYGLIITSTMPTTSSGYLFRVWQGSLSGASGTGTAIFDVMANNSVIARANFLATGGITAYYTSDERLKTNLRPIDAGKMILSLGRVREFEYIDSEIERNRLYKGSHIGLIYQDVKGSALSKMCFEREDGYGSLNYFDTSLTALLVGVAQEHEVRLTEDEREIKAVKEENKALRKEIELLKQIVARWRMQTR